MRRGCVFVFAALGAVGICAFGEEMPAEYQKVLDTLGRQGDFADNVLKINIPRNDLNITVDGVATPTAFGFGGWLAMTAGAGGHDVMMGDLVLLEREVNPVMSALLDNGLSVTALHNHFFFEQPRIFYMHVMGMGTPADLARKVKPALDLIPRGATPASAAKPSARGSLETAAIARITGHTGQASGPVYKITVGRPDLDITEMGAHINARMGLNTWAAFVPAPEGAAVAGDVAMLESELQPVLRALHRNGLQIVAIHQHMTGTQPVIIFLHYWGKGPAEKLAAGFKAALDCLGRLPVAQRH